MDYSTAAILGIIQGLAEYLPISSTGHLIIAEHLFGLNPADYISFDIIIHAATALAIIFYFWNDWKNILTSFKKNSMLSLLILGSIPAGIIGIFFEETITSSLRTPHAVAVGLILGSILIGISEYIYSKKTTVSKTFSFREAFTIGIFQALALIPGISRSGATISGGLLLGKERLEAARFSFLLATPIIVAATAKKIFDVDAFTQVSPSIFTVGFLTAFISGLFAIHVLLAIMKKRSLMPFVVYRIALAVVILMSIT